jgi:spermidine synthase
MTTLPPQGAASIQRLLIPLFALSGGTSLVYQTLWVRQSNLVFGTSELALCTVLAAFMGGLAIGSALAGRWAAHTTRPLRTYALLELFIGAYALAFPYLIKLITPIYVWFWHATEPPLHIFGLFQLVLVGLLLLAPTTCMGATLPVLARYVSQRRDDTGTKVGRLYGANTIGAVVGTGLAGFFLLPTLGVTTTTIYAAMANIALAGVAWAMDCRCGAIESAAVPRRPAADPVHDRYAPVLLTVAVLAGFCGLVYEVAWFRLMVLLLGASAYAFSAMLLAFLLGIGIGGWVGGSLADRSFRRGGQFALFKQLAMMQAGVAVTSGIALYSYGELPVMYVRLFTLFENHLEHLWIANLIMAMLVMMPPAMFMGATFPVLIRAASGGQEGLSATVGKIYSVNTIGAIAGAIVGGMVFLPVLHVRGTVICAISLNLLAAVTALWPLGAIKGPYEPRRLVGWTLASCAVAFMHIVPPAWNPLLMSGGLYKYASSITDRTRQGILDATTRNSQLLFYREGTSSVVTVGLNMSTTNLWLANNGKVDASSSGDLETQVLLGHVPFIFRPEAKEVMVIGLGSGISAGSVTLHETATRIDVVELEPAIIEASRFFDGYNHLPLEDPRVRVHINDARNHLLLTPDGTYDVVSSEPSNPWISGVSNLFTREFFELGKRKLKPGGVWTQWLHIYDMAPEDLRSLLATFADVYGHVRLFRVNAADLILVGSDAPLNWKLADIRDMMAHSPDIAADLRRCGITTAEDLLTRYLSSKPTLMQIAGNVERNTDDNMRIEYSAPRHLYENTVDTNYRLLMSEVEIPSSALNSESEAIALLEAYARRDDPRARFQLGTLSESLASTAMEVEEK